jgi:radical SAM protein with 4Fe4S-binding SPASM domain
MITSWNVTNKCNLACEHCYRNVGDEAQNELTTEEGIELLTEIAKAGFRLMVFSGVLLKLKEIGVGRCCLYHLDYTGRGKEIMEHDLTPSESRAAVSKYFEPTKMHHAQGFPIEKLLVGNYCDAGYLYLTLREEDPERAEWAMELLRKNGVDGTGETIADVDHLGNVHANQFWQDYSFGNVKERPFGEIWDDTFGPIMKGLKNKRDFIHGRCAASNCRFFDICKGLSRVRSLALTDDVWASDPACYLTDSEIMIQ